MRSPRRVLMLIAGWALILVTPLIGILPGPGGMFTLAAGIGLLLRSSHWARRTYVRGKRRWPRIGQMLDRALMRSSARRRARRMADASVGDGL